MKVIIAGSESVTVEHKEWISAGITAKIYTCNDYQDLTAILDRTAFDLMILECCGEFNLDSTLAFVKDRCPTLPVIVISGNQMAMDAVKAFRMGASDFLYFPIGREALLSRVREILKATGSGTSKENHINASDIDLSEDNVLSEHILFGEGEGMLAIKQIIDRILDTDLPVLITGESGTGKEMIARYLWHHSSRRGPFVKVNCAAIPTELLESELFGFERGAFTGAYRRKPGKFEAANGGFLFLDEISELSYQLQSKLLHVLQDGNVSTLGSTKEIETNVRVIAATNRDLAAAVHTGEFREDLFFRLNVVHLGIPPLRERPSHVTLLIDYFRGLFARKYNKEAVDLSLESQAFLHEYSWPGNIRELENLIRRATVLGGEDYMLTNNHGQNINGIGSGKGNGPDRPTEDNPAGPAVNSEMENLSLREIAKRASLEAEREVISRVLEMTRWNRKKTAKILDVSYKTLLTKIKETGLNSG